MEKKDKTDYGAAYRQYCTYAKGMSFKKFCEEQNYNYTKFWAQLQISMAYFCSIGLYFLV